MAASWFALALIAAVAGPALAQDRTPSVSVVGEAMAEVKPDIVVLSLTVMVEKPTAADAAAENARIARATIDAVKAGGVAAPDIQTVGISIYPEFSNGNGQRGVTGYQANDSLSVRVRDIAKAGAIAGAAVEAGALYQGVRFELSDRETREDALRVAAVENARHRAELYAKGAGMKLGPTRTIVAQDSSVPEPFPRAAMAMARAAPSLEPPIEAGLLTLRETVQATFDLSPP